jgi:Protein of unknown function (DUF3047)
VTTTRMRLGLMLAAVLTVTAAWAAQRVVVEDWSRYPVGTRGIPPSWKGHDWGIPAYDFTIVENDRHRVLRLKSHDEGSTIIKDIRGKVDLKATPVLEWQWKVVALPPGGYSCRAASDDQAAQIYVAWPRFPEALRSRLIGYVWDSTAPVGTVCKSEKTGTVTYIVVRSGLADLGTWITEQRNVREDFKRVYGEEPDAPAAVSISIDSNDTHSAAEAFVGPIVFREP